MKINETNYIEKLKKGDEKALDYIVDQHLPLVKGTVRKILMQFNDSGLIEECINDVFLSVWNNADKFKGKVEDFKKWIFAISKFKAIDYYRTKIKGAEVVLDTIEILGETSAEDELVILENKNEIMRLIDDLEPVDRKIFVLRFILGYKSTEIAEKLNITKAAVDNRIYREKRKLRKKLIKSNLEVV
ncbi:sigma-70 family RNA polymerase sigma factor [Clostridium coskatii]|uniref:RNA polymerase sigma factor SigX n=1 Tax=Clostridium coskatii TaxID=1705578 RepID=A0A166RRF4_9CLOT|nr:sigma-70 family RNA polymerase sigma factor [Clostridium coskatii]OAA91028.1 RNA polymerase sigma factor SigX [Clostridium coskatii]OBR97069.1 RNA polymerase sigma factor SigX [Clostridium coskatii]